MDRNEIRAAYLAKRASLQHIRPSEAEMEALAFGLQWQAWRYYRQQRLSGLNHDQALEQCCWWLDPNDH